MSADFFLRHFAGFLIQIGAGMLLCLLPFQEGAFRYSARQVRVGSAILAVGSSVLFPLVIRMPFASEPYQSVIANLYMLLAIVIFLVIYFVSVRVETVRKLIVLVLTIFYAATQYLLVNFIISLLHVDEVQEIYAPVTLALYVVTAIIMLPVFVLLMRKGGAGISGGD